MSFVSYAQNFEDVILYRALKDVDRGTYIDVGAHDPTVHSVTRAFYDRGWRGVNVEPVLHWYKRLIDERTEDLNLRVAVDETDGERVFYEVVDTGLSTLREDVAKRHSEDGYRVRRWEVPVRTLDSILDEYSISVIHFLKVDVEGAEAGVLRSLDFGKVRPWIFVVEATEPLSTTSSHDEWHETLSQNDYEYVYFDGLNRFYLAIEQAKRKTAFQEPPSVFDEFVSYNEWEAQKRAAEMRKALSQVKQELTRAQEGLESAERELHAVYSSTSWRVTRPIRSLKAAFHWLIALVERVRTFAVRGIRRWTGIILRGVVGQLSRRPCIRAGMSRILGRFPRIKTRLQTLIADSSDPSSISIGGFSRVARDESSLTSRGRDVYRILLDGLEKRDR